MDVKLAGGGDEGELREEETEHGERAALVQDEPPEQVKYIYKCLETSVKSM